MAGGIVAGGQEAIELQIHKKLMNGKRHANELLGNEKVIDPWDHCDQTGHPKVSKLRWQSIRSCGHIRSTRCSSTNMLLNYATVASHLLRNIYMSSHSRPECLMGCAVEVAKTSNQTCWMDWCEMLGIEGCDLSVEKLYFMKSGDPHCEF
jgi:hypothetical protein